MNQILLKNQILTIKRCHGLGNVICLLPVLDHLYQQGHTINVITRREWLHTFSTLKPEFLWTYPQQNSTNTRTNTRTNTNIDTDITTDAHTNAHTNTDTATNAIADTNTKPAPLPEPIPLPEPVNQQSNKNPTTTTDFSNPIDLDHQTENLLPTEHRTNEFAHLLGLQHLIKTPVIKIPPIWSRPFTHLRGSIVFAPEGGHPARTWPTEKANQLHYYIKKQNPNQKLTLIGTKPSPEIQADYDIRTKLELHQLLGLLSVANAVITMDSGVLHLAAALNIPTIALFGGIDPQFRIRPEQKVIALQTDMNCCPCNKQEHCLQTSSPFDCIKNLTPQHVIYALNQLHNLQHLTIIRCPHK